MEKEPEAEASPNDVKRINHELFVITARVEGMATVVQVLEARLSDMTSALAELTTLTANLAEHVVAVSGTDVTPDPARKLWVVDIPESDEYAVGPVQVLIEQFGDRPPTVAFRRDKWNTWGRPFQAGVAP
jgi:hypothetical protein